MKVHVSRFVSQPLCFSSLVPFPPLFVYLPICPSIHLSFFPSPFQLRSTLSARTRLFTFPILSFLFIRSPLCGKTLLPRPTIVVRHGRHSRPKQIASRSFSFPRYYACDEFGDPRARHVRESSSFHFPNLVNPQK